MISDSILYNETLGLDLYEKVLLSMYIRRSKQYDKVFASDRNDSKALGIHRNYVSPRRKHLEELGLIECIPSKGKKTEIKIKTELL